MLALCRTFAVVVLVALGWMVYGTEDAKDDGAKSSARIAEPGKTRDASSGDPSDERVLPELPLDELLKPRPPKEPDEALKTFETVAGFHIELVAHEPDVVDPVAATFDADGRLYVAEMRDYPFRPKDGETPIGRIRRLEDTDGDGRFDHITVFADELLWPTGVIPWQGGVFVAAAPHIYYFKDTDDDGKADEHRIVFSGFGVQNEQGSVNNLAWGLDGRIYASTSENGGEVRPADDPNAQPVVINGRDFCFDPATGSFELVTGGGQFGNAFDDWGNRFLCVESDPSMHVVLPNRYLARNPFLAVPRAINDLTPAPTPVFRISPLEGWRVVRSSRRLSLGERSEESSGLSHHVLDGVAGLMIYRGHAYPPDLLGNLIVGDGQTNLIHRRRLVPDGVTFRSLRADENTEFVRSTDTWFRPVNAINAPDGTVYITDMAREVIESVHVPWDVVGRINLNSQGRGRIYRLAPDGFKASAPPRLSGAMTKELVAYLAHRNGWWRDTSQRLLRERRDAAAIEPLRRVLREETFDLGRLHALYALSQLDGLADADLIVGLTDVSAGIREHSVRLAECRLNQSSDLRALVSQMAEDDSPRVRLQIAFSLGEISGEASARHAAIKGLAAIAQRDGDDPWIHRAILSSCKDYAEPLIVDLVGSEHTGEKVCNVTLIRQLAFLVGRGEDSQSRARELFDLLEAAGLPGTAPGTLQSILLGLADGLRGAGTSLQSLRAKLTASENQIVDRVIDDAFLTAGDANATSDARDQAIQLLSCGDFDTVAATLGELLVPREPEALQRAAVQALATFDNPRAAAMLLEPWRQLTPPVREAVVQAIFGRPGWLDAFLAAIESGDVATNNITNVQQGILLANRDAGLRARAEKLFAADMSPRSEVYERYKPALELQGSSTAGERVYERECMICHKIGTKGHAVGPNLALTMHRAPAELLLHILDPNREVQPAYIQYMVVDRSGGIYSGLVAAETASSITLRRDKGFEQTILKQEIDEITSGDKSLMPEGFEKVIDPPQMADLLSFLKELRYDIGTEPGRRDDALADP